MSKEFPYFRITVQEWQNGDISDETLTNQGLFMQICCYYWAHNCKVTRIQLEKRFRFHKKNIKNLIKSKILKENSSNIHINFLDLQIYSIEKEKKFYSDMGKLGQKAKKSKAPLVSESKPPLSNKDKDKEKDKDPSTKRKKNPIWDYLCELFQLNPVTVQERKELGRIVSDFKKKEATPERIKKIHDEFKRVWPKASCTHRALLKHYDYLKNSIVNGSDDDGYGDIKRI